MTIIARLETLTDAYAGLEALRSNAIAAELAKDGNDLVIGVHDGLVHNAMEVLRGDGKIPPSRIAQERGNSANNLIGFEEHNA